MSDIHFQLAVFFSPKNPKKNIKNKRELYGVEIIKAGSLKRALTRCNRSLWLCCMLLAVWMRPWCPLSFFRNTTDTVLVRVNRVPYIRLSLLSHGAGLLTHSSPRSWVTTNFFHHSHNYTERSAPVVIRKRWWLYFCFAGIVNSNLRFTGGLIMVQHVLDFIPLHASRLEQDIMCFF